MGLLEYAKEQSAKIDIVKKVAVELLRTEELDEKRLKLLLEDAYETGHYVGHCRGEHYIKGVYGLYEKEELGVDPSWNKNI